MKKLWKNAKTRKVIAYLIFAYALYGIIRMIFIPVSIPTVNPSTAFKTGYLVGYYLTPFILAFIGWLFLQSGKNLQEAKDIELNNN